MYVYALPREIDTERVVAVFEVLRMLLPEREHIASMSPVEIGDLVEQEDDSAILPVSVEFAVHREGVRELMQLFRIAGLLTIADSLTEEELAILFERTENENPAGIVALEQFLSTDLLAYAIEPKPHEQQLRRSFSTPGFTSALDSILQNSALRDARHLLGGRMGAALKQQDLWPLPFMTFAERVLVPGEADGWYHLSLKLQVHRRS